MERLAAAATDLRSLRVNLLGLLRNQLPIDWAVVVATDPRTAVGVDPVATVPDGVHLPSLIRSKYLTRHHRWTTLDGAEALADDPGASRVWREVQAVYGVADVLSGVLRDAYGTWGFLDLWSRSSFSAADLALVDAVAPAVTAAVRRLQAQQLRPRLAAGAGGPVVLVLGDDLEVLGSTEVARDWLAHLLPPSAGVPPVPAIAWNVAAQLLAVEEAVDDHEPMGRVHLADGVWITVRAARLGEEGRLAVSMEPVSGADRSELVARAYALTTRETEVMEAVCAGWTNAEVATAHHLSPLTVQDHLKSIFARTSVHSRGELAALALGVPAPD